MLSHPNLVAWLDLEMTGLDPDKERIIEIAILITDEDLAVLAEGPDLVVHQEEGFLGAMDTWNRKHHGESGLLEKVRSSTISEAEAQDQVMAFLQATIPAGKVPLAGNSIHQDRAFLARYMPRIHQFFHYRNIDVSTVKELAMRWFPDAFPRRPRKKQAHRAMDDILESIAELRFYRETIFKEK
ncbi:MAG: oligoribonuclease [Planctomycetota bacterium]